MEETANFFFIFIDFLNKITNILIYSIFNCFRIDFYLIIPYPDSFLGLLNSFCFGSFFSNLVKTLVIIFLQVFFNSFTFLIL